MSNTPLNVASWLPQTLGPVNLANAMQLGQQYLVAWDPTAGEYVAIVVPTIDGDVVATDSAQTLTNKTLSDPVLGYAGMSAPGAHPFGASGVGPRVITATYFDDGNPMTDGFVQQIVTSLTTTSTSANQQIYVAVLGTLGNDWAVTLDVTFSVRALGGAHGEGKRHVGYKRVGAAPPTVSSTMQSGTDGGTIGGTVAFAVSANNVALVVTPSDATKRIWTAEVHALYQPAVT